jgi:hypothetical protein
LDDHAMTSRSDNLTLVMVLLLMLVMTHPQSYDIAGEPIDSLIDYQLQPATGKVTWPMMMRGVGRSSASGR